MKSAPLLLLILLALLTLPAFAIDDGLARTPPMGWNSWNKFGCKVDEQIIRETVDAMLSKGMKDAGYSYVVIDDCWQVSRDDNGAIVPDPKHFPSGIKALADYAHSKGLKLGIYSDGGTGTCCNRPGSSGYEFQDARTYASWGIDYLKYDWCNSGTQDTRASYALMRDALKKAGRPIVFSLCEWGSTKPWLWAANTGHLWRTSGDIADCFDCKRDWGGVGFVRILDQQVGLESYSGPGHWNDPDMLEIGNENLTPIESRAHFSLWAILAAPLMAGNDLRSMTPETAEILTNKEVIAVDQDPVGLQGRRIRKDGDLEIWSKQLHDGSRAVVLFNRSASQQTMEVKWEELGYPQHLSAAVRDLWSHKDLGQMTGRFSSPVAAHGAVMVTVRP